MNNSTLAIANWNYLQWYIIYMSQGTLISIGNLLIVCAISRYAALRHKKEFVIMRGLSLADAIYLSGFFFGGLYRTRLLMNGTQDSMVSVWDCMMTLQSICWTFSRVLAPMMLCTMSIDRLLCMLAPLSYIRWSSTYAYILVGSTYLVNIILGIYMYVTTFGSSEWVPAMCLFKASVVHNGTHPLVAWYWIHSPQYFAVISVVVYIVVLALFKRTNAIVFDTEAHPMQQYELNRQRRVTLTLSASALCTLLLYIIPFTLASQAFEVGLYDLALGLWCLTNTNSLANVFIYPLGYAEVRQAVKSFLLCRQMPTDLKMWAPQGSDIKVTNNSLHRMITKPTRDHLVPKPAAHVHVVPENNAVIVLEL